MHLIRHNLDVVDNLNARKNLKFICNRLEFELDEHRRNAMPKAVYTLTKDQKRRRCEWVLGLKFSDDYAYNIGRCIDMTKLRMHGMKTHDCHPQDVALVPKVATNNQTYDLHDPDGIQIVADLSIVHQQHACTSLTQHIQTDDEEDEDDEDNFEDYETDEYEAT
ncbi:UNVERIFIED_CONTAM: hypothetical protein Scaly_1051200 [Sesamum calycinum]|uniref:Uncharacterized protein n=1 Tax=Sesamum calycinum TaxID=2727403 RepID=A0AAW2QKH2_9LAMI